MCLDERNVIEVLKAHKGEMLTAHLIIKLATEMKAAEKVHVSHAHAEPELWGW